METLKPVPVDMAWGEGRSLVLSWSDGHRSTFEPQYLRSRCRCAACVHEWTGATLLDPATLPADLQPLEVAPVGRYALQVQWSDGHATGIYSFDYLRSICPCCHGTRD